MTEIYRKMMTVTTKPKPERPPKNHDARVDVKKLLIRSGIEMFTKQGYMTSEINSILKKVGIPKGSFYYYFENKEPLDTFSTVFIDQIVNEKA